MWAGRTLGEAGGTAETGGSRKRVGGAAPAGVGGASGVGGAAASRLGARGWAALEGAAAAPVLSRLACCSERRLPSRSEPPRWRRTASLRPVSRA